MCACAQFGSIHKPYGFTFTHTQMHTLFNKKNLFVHEQKAAVVSCCIITPLITLTCNRVTAHKHKQTRPSPPQPPRLGRSSSTLSFTSLSALSHFLHLLWSLSFSLLHSFSTLCPGKPCPWPLNLSLSLCLSPSLSRFLISVCTESREAVWLLHCLLCELSLSLPLSLSILEKCHAALTPFQCLYQSTEPPKSKNLELITYFLSYV